MVLRDRRRREGIEAESLGSEVESQEPLSMERWDEVLESKGEGCRRRQAGVSASAAVDRRVPVRIPNLKLHIKLRFG
jgi:hypothetical protein